MLKRIHRSRKGVYEVVEEVLLFGVGIAIMIGVVGLFNSVEKDMLSTLGESRLEVANKYVASLAISLQSTNCTRCYATVALPPLIGGEGYTIRGSPEKTTTISAGKYVFGENITAPADGLVQSTYRYLQVQYDGNTGKIKLYGVPNY